MAENLCWPSESQQGVGLKGVEVDCRLSTKKAKLGAENFVYSEVS